MSAASCPPQPSEPEQRPPLAAAPISEPIETAPPFPTQISVDRSTAELAHDPGDELAQGAWGFADTRFTLHPDGTVQLSGGRYPLSGQVLPHVIPWVEKTLGVTLAADDVVPAAPSRPLPPPAGGDALARELAAALAPAQVSVDAAVRRRHSHGHTQAEIWARNFGDHPPRAPDYVVMARSQADVEAVVSVACRRGASVIPYGGGTSVTEAFCVPPGETRPVICLNTRGLDRLVWVDPVNRLACIEAGALGRHLAAALARYGLTLGHEPDSMEFSTLGGWIATHASGMKKNRYGNIENLVLDMSVVGVDGLIARSQVAPRESIGLDVQRLMFGSEGGLGVVTRATVKLFDLPEAQRYDSALFPDLDAGIEFMYALSQSEALPASVRLVDNTQFHFGMALRGPDDSLSRWRRQATRLFLKKMKGFDVEKMVACTLVFEGSLAEVQRQRRQVLHLARDLGGVAGGAENGRRGYQLTFGIAYIRDFIMRHWVVAESFETSVPWSGVGPLIERVKRRVMREHHSRGLPGRPALMSRVTQIYSSGACIYFYLGLYLKGVPEPSRVFAEVEAAARDEILLAGGSLSHHHGVGKLRQSWLPRVMSRAGLAWGRRAKEALDADNVFGCGNQQYR